jgi:hypothetical protein
MAIAATSHGMPRAPDMPRHLGRHDHVERFDLVRLVATAMFMSCASKFAWSSPVVVAAQKVATAVPVTGW